MIIISDLDEIPNPKVINNFKENMRYAVFKQKHFYYKFNLQSQKNPVWFVSRICLKKYLTCAGKEKIFLGIAKPENTLLALVYIANRCDTPPIARVSRGCRTGVAKHPFSLIHGPWALFHALCDTTAIPCRHPADTKADT